jgi:hypothetical protein
MSNLNRLETVEHLIVIFIFDPIMKLALHYAETMLLEDFAIPFIWSKSVMLPIFWNVYAFIVLGYRFFNNHKATW